MLQHKIKELCKLNGITIETLEKSAELSNKSIYRWGLKADSEDYVMPSADKLARVAKILGTTVEELLE